MNAAIRKLNHRHEAVVNWLVAHPDRTLRDCAEFFGYTKEWIYRLVNTDMFQAAYRKRAEEAGVVAVHAMKEKILGLAALTVDETAGRIISGQASERFLGETLKTTLGALGYGAGVVQAQQQNVHLHLDPQVIIEARERAASLKEGRTEAKGAT